MGYLCASFIGLSVLDLGPMYATDVRQTDIRQHHRLMPPPRGRGIIIVRYIKAQTWPETYCDDDRWQSAELNVPVIRVKICILDPECNRAHFHLFAVFAGLVIGACFELRNEANLSE